MEPLGSAAVGPESASASQQRMRLGFAVQVLGQRALKSHDTRRWQHHPHLRVSLGYLQQIFEYLHTNDIRLYRISSQIAPYITHPDLPQFHRQIEECAEQLQALGKLARAWRLRLSMHPAQYIILNAEDERIYQAAVREFLYHTRFLDALGLSASAKIITHGGGVYGQKQQASERFARRYEQLPEAVRRRLVLENDEKSYSVPDLLALHRLTGIPLVFDWLHHAANRPPELSAAEALRLCLATWPTDQRPKIHFSSARQEPRTLTRRPSTGARQTFQAAPLPAQHADYINADELLGFLREVDAGVSTCFDIMLEAKQKDLALLQVRKALQAAGLQAIIW
jgi:UV DNA damage endonuclease